METKNLSLVAVGIVLVAAVMVSYLISRPIIVQQKEMPVFWGEGVVVQRAIEGIRGQEKVMRAEGMIAQKAMKAEKARVIPMPQPGVAVPLPILPPKISYSVLPQYPQSALRQGLVGTTILSVFIGTNGGADRVEVKASSGIGALDQSAVVAVSQWKFSPATQGGLALASCFEVPVSFRIPDLGN